MNHNAFGMEKTEINKLLQNRNVRRYVETTLVSVIGALDVDDSEGLAYSLLDIAESYSSLGDYEARAHDLLESQGVTAASIGEKLTGRADLIYDQIKDHIRGRVLDLGCGDGKVGEKIANEGLEVTLADTYKHDHIDETGLPFQEFRQLEQVPLEDGQYDSVLLLTVMHHSSNPVKQEGYVAGTLEEAKRLAKPGGRIIAIESVYGVNPGEVGNADEFTKLSSEEQRLTNIFFDHFYNRVIHYSEDHGKKVNVPFNFNTPEGWNAEAIALGMKPVATEHLGIDQPTVPEYHTLHVWEVE